MDIVKELLQLLSCQLAWCSPSKIDGLYLICKGKVWADFHFVADRIHISLPELQPYGGVEAAIDTSAFAKWNMNIESCHIFVYKSTNKV